MTAFILYSGYILNVWVAVRVIQNANLLVIGMRGSTRSMKIVEHKGKLRLGGSCANCNESYSASYYPGKDGFRVIGEYLEDGSYITEPFNLCEDCYHEIKE